MNKDSFVIRSYLEFGKRAMHAYLTNVVRRTYIAARQRSYMDLVLAGKNRKAIIFFTPSRNNVNGGIMSIISLAKETENLQSLHGADVFVCSYLGNPPLLKYTKFPNDRIILDFGQLLNRFEKGTEVLLHIPEYFVPTLLVRGAELMSMSSHNWKFNVLLQNIDMTPKREHIETLSKIGSVTATTAHEAYSGMETQEALGCIVHHLSSWGIPYPFERKPFSERENIFIVSPDLHEKRENILGELRARLPEFKFVTIKRMAYADYRKLIAKAKFSLTFGEGLDGYFTEMIFGGGIGCAVYNTRFFTKEFKDIPFVYLSWEALLTRLPGDVKAANIPGKYESFNDAPYRLLNQQFSPEILRKNMISYYKTYFSRN